MTEESRKIIREKLAAYAHDAWSGWMKYQKEKCPQLWEHLPAWAQSRWGRQMGTEYIALPETEKESDRAEADRMLAIFAELDKPDEAYERGREAGHEDFFKPYPVENSKEDKALPKEDLPDMRSTLADLIKERDELKARADALAEALDAAIDRLRAYDGDPNENHDLQRALDDYADYRSAAHREGKEKV